MSLVHQKPRRKSGKLIVEQKSLQGKTFSVMNQLYLSDGFRQSNANPSPSVLDIFLVILLVRSESMITLRFLDWFVVFSITVDYVTIDTKQSLSFRLNQFSAVPENLTQFSSWPSSILPSTVSNTALRSIDTNKKIEIDNLTRVVSVLRPDLKTP